jgi:hypothetical protein
MPVAPGAPGAPGGPGGPGGPDGPAAPDGPRWPAAPDAPAGPVAPWVPARPDAPVGPGGPLAPVAPRVPSVPAGPRGPVRPGPPRRPAGPRALHASACSPRAQRACAGTTRSQPAPRRRQAWIVARVASWRVTAASAPAAANSSSTASASAPRRVIDDEPIFEASSLSDPDIEEGATPAHERMCVFWHTFGSKSSQASVGTGVGGFGARATRGGARMGEARQGVSRRWSGCMRSNTLFQAGTARLRRAHTRARVRRRAAQGRHGGVPRPLGGREPRHAALRRLPGAVRVLERRPHPRLRDLCARPRSVASRLRPALRPVGRRVVLLGGLALAIAGLMVFAFARGTPWLFAARSAQGVCRRSRERHYDGRARCGRARANGLRFPVCSRSSWASPRPSSRARRSCRCPSLRPRPAAAGASSGLASPARCGRALRASA